jgi:hypothetical protein
MTTSVVVSNEPYGEFLAMAQNRRSPINKNVPKRSNDVGKGTGDYCRAGKGSPCVAGGARARRCELCHGVADRGPQRDRVGGWARDHGAQAAARTGVRRGSKHGGQTRMPRRTRLRSKPASAGQACGASKGMGAGRMAVKPKRGAPNGGYAGNVAERRFAVLEIGKDVKAADRTEPSTIQTHRTRFGGFAPPPI